MQLVHRNNDVGPGNVRPGDLIWRGRRPYTFEGFSEPIPGLRIPRILVKDDEGRTYRLRPAEFDCYVVNDHG